jgi:hypothetical protein
LPEILTPRHPAHNVNNARGFGMTKFRYVTPSMRAAADKVFAIPASFGGYRSNPGPEMTDFERSLALMRERGDVYEPTPFDSTSGAGGERGQTYNVPAGVREKMKEFKRQRREGRFAGSRSMAEEYSKYLKSNPAQRTMQAMRNGTCPLSGERISMGDSITKTNAGWVLTRHAGRS